MKFLECDRQAVILEKEVRPGPVTVSQLERQTCYQVINVYFNVVEADSRIREITEVGRDVLRFKTVVNLTTQMGQIQNARLVNPLFTPEWLIYRTFVILVNKTQATVTTHQLKSLMLSIFVLLNGLKVYYRIVSTPLNCPRPLY